MAFTQSTDGVDVSISSFRSPWRAAFRASETVLITLIRMFHNAPREGAGGLTVGDLPYGRRCPLIFMLIGSKSYEVVGDHQEKSMKAKSAKGPARFDRSAELNQNGKEYLRLELDHKTRLEVESLARAAGCTPFEMCVSLLRERISQHF
jgi:hypothetical protein